jgi:hypothetical protein
VTLGLWVWFALSYERAHKQQRQDAVTSGLCWAVALGMVLLDHWGSVSAVVTFGAAGLGLARLMWHLRTGS